MLVESGLVCVHAGDGSVFRFRPSLGRIALLGNPVEVVATFSALHGPRAAAEATYVLACLCDQDDPTPLIGWTDEAGHHAGAMPAIEQIVIARHLMQHGIAGRASPGKGDGEYSDRFDAGEYIAAARVHLGLSSADAEALSMTEFQTMLEMKFPGQTGGRKDVPSREDYDAAVKAIEERRHG